MEEPSETQTPRGSKGIEEPRESMRIAEIQEFTETEITQNMEEPSETETPRGSKGIEEPRESTGIAKNQKPTDIPITQNMEEPSGTETPRGSKGIEEPRESMRIAEIQEFTETEITQNMEEPSGTETPRGSKGIKEPRESTGIAKNQKPTDIPTTQDMEEPSGTETPRGSKGIEEPGESSRIVEIQEPTDKTTAEPSTDTELLEAQKDEESAHLNRQTGALVPVESSPSLSLLGWLRSYISTGWNSISSLLPDWLCFWAYPQPSQTKEEEPGDAAENEDDEDPPTLLDLSDLSEDVDATLPSAVMPGAWLAASYIGLSCDVAVPSCSASIECKEAGMKGKSFKENVDKIREIIESTYSTYLRCLQGYRTVGIFSRSPDSDYKWLISQLKSKPFQSTVCIVPPYYISNNRKRVEFWDAVSRCTFGILYHTKNRGRINLVDVTDSLYDEELKYLSEHLGKDNVIVVIDDLEDTGDEMKTRILECQPSITNLAKDLILFNANDKPMTISEIEQES